MIRQFRHASNRINDCSALTKIIKGRPVSIAIAANYYFIFYSGGILDGCDNT